jgi:F-type H+-transporting ATPase subunit delta
MADIGVARDFESWPETVLNANIRQARIARVYAESLLQVAEKTGEVERIGEEMEAFVRDVLAPNPQIAAFVGFPAISRRRRGPILEAALHNNVSPLLEHFLGVLNQNNRLDFFRSIVAAYRDLLDKRAGRVRVQVRSAVALGGEERDEIRRTLAASLGKDPIITVRVDPDLLGGLVVQVGDTVYDTSVRSRLNALRTQLMARGTNVAKA